MDNTNTSFGFYTDVVKLYIHHGTQTFIYSELYILEQSTIVCIYIISNNIVKVQTIFNILF